MLSIHTCYIRYFVAAIFSLMVNSTTAATYNVSVAGSDAIFLVGRADVTIPPASDPWNTGAYLVRHSGPTPEEIQETLSPFIPEAGNDVVRVIDPVIGGVSFYDGFGASCYGLSGNGIDLVGKYSWR